MELILAYMSLALIVSAICSVLEATLLSTPLSYVTTLETQGAKGASRLKNLKVNIDRPISAILVVNTIQQAFQTTAVAGLVAGHLQWNGGFA